MKYLLAIALVLGTISTGVIRAQFGPDAKYQRGADGDQCVHRTGIHGL